MRAAKPAMLAALVTIAAGCGDGVSGPDIPPALDVVVVDGVRFEASTRFSEDKPDHWLVVTTTATNERSDSVDVEFRERTCPHLGFLVHDNPNREGNPVWDNMAPTAVCQARPVNFTLSADGSEELQIVEPIDEILGSSRPSGRYYFTVVLRLATGPVAVKAGDLEL